MNVPEATRAWQSLPEAEGPTAGGPAAGEDVCLEGCLLGHYRVREPLGRGGFGTVWAAEDLRLGREVALKLLVRSQGLDEAGRRLMEAEARTIAALEHPGIVTLHALEEADGQFFLVMERVRGVTLAGLLAEGPMPLGRVLDLGIQMARAMAVAGEAGVVHRDLTPRNVMVGDGERIKILDFGLALRGALADTHGHSAPGNLTGTVPYMAPEQLQGGMVDPRTDLFALGVMLFEMAAGRRPFTGATLRDTAWAILEEAPVWPPDFPTGLRRVVSRCLEKDPAARFPSGRELALALERLKGGASGPSLAVLPFQDMGADQDDEHLCEGLAGELLKGLARIPGLRLVPRTTSFALKGSALPPERLSERLAAGWLVTGSLDRTGDRCAVEVTLVDGASGLAVWQTRVDREREELAGVHRELAEGLAGALGLPLLPGAWSKVSSEAFEAYLRGRQFYFRFHRHAMRFALEMYREAVALAPDFAAAWAGIATCSAWLYIYVSRSAANREQAEEASARALALDPQSPEGLAARGVARSALGQKEEAEADFLAALARDPGLYEAAYFLARHRFAGGDMPGALEAFQQAMVLWPEDCQAPLLVAQVHEALGDPAAAAETRWRGVHLAEARLRHAPDDVRTRYLAANALVALGERERGLAWARLARILDPDDPMLLYNLGCIHALGGAVDEALDCLEASVKTGLTQKGWFLHDGDLIGLRELPRFQAILDTMEG